MPVSVNMPQMRQREERDPLDTLLKGLSIAANVYGIKEASQKQDLLAKEMEMKNTDREMLAKEKADAAKRELAGRGQMIDESGNIVDDPKSSFFMQRQAEIKRKSEVDPYTSATREQTALLRQLDIDEKKRLAAQKADPYRMENLPKEKQIVASTLAENKAKMMATGNMVDALVSQLDDPNISDDQKVAAANEQLKLLNSALGPDALGEGEVDRVSKFLSSTPSPSVGKWMPGPDIEGFKTQLKNAQARNKQAVMALDKQTNQILGRETIESQDDAKAKRLQELMAEKRARQGLNAVIPKR